MSFYYKTFARACFLPYLGGTVLHVLRLFFDPKIENLPVEVDWLVVLIAGYGGAGLLVFVNRISFINRWDKIAYALVTFHLLGSAFLHGYMIFVDDRSILNVFPWGYSFFAVAYFVALGLYVFRLSKRLYAPK